MCMTDKCHVCPEYSQHGNGLLGASRAKDQLRVDDADRHSIDFFRAMSAVQGKSYESVDDCWESAIIADRYLNKKLKTQVPDTSMANGATSHSQTTAIVNPSSAF